MMIERVTHENDVWHLMTHDDIPLTTTTTRELYKAIRCHKLKQPDLSSLNAESRATWDDSCTKAGVRQ